MSPFEHLLLWGLRFLHFLRNRAVVVGSWKSARNVQEPLLRSFRWRAIIKAIAVIGKLLQIESTCMRFLLDDPLTKFHLKEYLTFFGILGLIIFDYFNRIILLDWPARCGVHKVRTCRRLPLNRVKNPMRFVLTLYLSSVWIYQLFISSKTSMHSSVNLILVKKSLDRYIWHFWVVWFVHLLHRAALIFWFSRMVIILISWSINVAFRSLNSWDKRLLQILAALVLEVRIGLLKTLHSFLHKIIRILEHFLSL